MVEGFAPLQQKVSLEAQRLDNLGVNMPQAIADLRTELKNQIAGVETLVTSMQEAMNQVTQQFGADAQSQIAMDVKVDQSDAKINALIMQMQHAKNQEVQQRLPQDYFQGRVNR